jgi:hypothetical protein
MSAVHEERQLNTHQRRALELLAAAGEQGCTGTSCMSCTRRNAILVIPSQDVRGMGATWPCARVDGTCVGNYRRRCRYYARCAV